MHKKCLRTAHLRRFAHAAGPTPRAECRKPCEDRSQAQALELIWKRTWTSMMQSAEMSARRLISGSERIGKKRNLGSATGNSDALEGLTAS